MPRKIFPLPSVEDPKSARTLGEYIASGYQVRARCTNAGCNHNVSVNLVVVARYLGATHGAAPDELKPYFYCPPCREAGLGDDNIVFTHYSPTAPCCTVSQRWVVDKTAA
ncbi:MAG: hypothetical protein M9924_04275 [Rhizobiaceae bacterium]|nr:hypothetical protein [Rhizobiaceae bacterium]